MAGSQARNDRVPCGGCNQVFNRRADMERHHELKHKGKRYYCEIGNCDYSAGRAYTRNSHREKKHPDAYSFTLQIPSDTDGGQSSNNQNGVAYMEEPLDSSGSRMPLMGNSPMPHYGSSTPGSSTQGEFSESPINYESYQAQEYQGGESYQYQAASSSDQYGNQSYGGESTHQYQNGYGGSHDQTSQWNANQTSGRYSY
ncbi:hypothetical protein GLAREA_11608 [Glarea lozoyensis ATCC 20868]|uniref:C2H2-type domain-containing protein n=1 Tax=Glarea lozoyensis (strain ATCC 20868 / MF5171) TaxID=1116229 RepID=S3CEV5_GLAL2|nr:uncharacterized protein GLAREA_11608 [Glarea lozoyensis ATCC 20868]EPE25027.1 hypothetical protein GLAREA_11608 [Glarea lozoyensis ATCC 20868]